MSGYITAPALLGRLAGAVGAAAYIVPRVQSILNPKDNIITALQNFGTAVENQFAPPGQKRAYVGSNPVAVAGNRRLNLDAAERPVVNPEFLRPDYSGAGERARRFQEYKTGRDIPGANTDYSSRLNAVANTPEERAYQGEKARVAQLTEQDPLFKKYRIGELTKAYNAAKGDEREKIGLEIWATTNPDLARNLKPGQLGYQEATSAFQSINPLGRFQAQTGDMQYANNMTQPTAGLGTIDPYSQETLNMPLTGIQVPPTNQIATKEMFASASPIPGAAQTFTNPMQFLTPDDTSQVQKALIKRAFESRLK
jgi:hypothetical protein